MLTEVPPTEANATRERTTIAMLTLRLRALTDELATLEAAAGRAVTSGSGDAASAELLQVRSRLQVLADERRRTLDEELLRIQAEALAEIEAARTAAERAAGGQPKLSGIDDAFTPRARPVSVQVDHEALAAAIAAALDARVPEVPARPRRVEPVAAPVKKSALASLMHPDVFLSLVAMVVVIVVLIAWSS